VFGYFLYNTRLHTFHIQDIQSCALLFFRGQKRCLLVLAAASGRMRQREHKFPRGMWLVACLRVMRGSANGTGGWGWRENACLLRSAGVRAVLLELVPRSIAFGDDLSVDVVGPVVLAVDRHSHEIAERHLVGRPAVEHRVEHLGVDAGLEPREFTGDAICLELDDVLGQDAELLLGIVDPLETCGHPIVDTECAHVRTLGVEVAVVGERLQAEQLVGGEAHDSCGDRFGALAPTLESLAPIRVVREGGVNHRRRFRTIHRVDGDDLDVEIFVVHPLLRRGHRLDGVGGLPVVPGVLHARVVHDRGVLVVAVHVERNQEETGDEADDAPVVVALHGICSQLSTVRPSAPWN